MTLHVDNEIADYWSTKDMTPKHPIMKYLSRDRFMELYMRVQFHRDEEQGPYEKVANNSLFLCLFLVEIS
jgi:hypothetical protein